MYRYFPAVVLLAAVTAISSSVALDRLSELPGDLVAVYGTADRKHMVEEPTQGDKYEKYSSVPLKIHAVVYGNVEGDTVELVLLTRSATKPEGMYLYRGDESGIWYLRPSKIGDRKVYVPAVTPSAGASVETIRESIALAHHVIKESPAEPSKEEIQDAIGIAQRQLKALEPKESGLSSALLESLREGHLIFDVPCCLVSKFSGLLTSKETPSYVENAKIFATAGDSLCVPVIDDVCIPERAKLDAFVTETQDKSKKLRLRVKVSLGTRVANGSMQLEVLGIKILKLLGPVEGGAKAPAKGR